jgi:glycosyltransferase involved in cell wall biosynthesis
MPGVLRDITELPTPPVGKRGWPWTEAEIVPLSPMEAAALPAISLVTPSFQQGQFVEETLRSVLLQGYPKLEYHVIDGGSSDASAAIIEKYSPWLTSWVSEKDRGQSHAINKGLERCHGQLVGWLNSDDIFTPGALFKLGRAWNAASPTDLLVGHGIIADLAGRTVFEPRLDFELGEEALGDWIRSNSFMQPSCLFPRELHGAPLRVDESLRYCMDFDLWLRMARAGCRLRRVEGMLSISKSHGETKSNSARRFMHAETLVQLSRLGHFDAVHRELRRWAEQTSLLEAAGRRLGPLFRLARSLEKRRRRGRG